MTDKRTARKRGDDKRQAEEEEEKESNNRANNKAAANFKPTSSSSSSSSLGDDGVEDGEGGACMVLAGTAACMARTPSTTHRQLAAQASTHNVGLRFISRPFHHFMCGAGGGLPLWLVCLCTSQCS